jgi:hypothetical protein
MKEEDTQKKSLNKRKEKKFFFENKLKKRHNHVEKGKRIKVS